MNIKFLAGVFALSLFLGSACSKKISCLDAEILLGFVNTPLSDIDTVILKKYALNSNFNNPIDSITIIPNTNAEVVMRTTGDTAVLRLFNAERGVKAGFEWQIILPKVGKSYTLSNIQQTNNEIKCGTFNTDCFCNNLITGISLNNQNAIPNSFNFSTIFLR